MDVSYAAWLRMTEESAVLDGENFVFLFDRRYTNRLNRMSRVFFEAYAMAVKELAEEEDRFPSLSEIESRMEGGAVYAYKDRLMRSTEFFDEVKISGISYLIPRAKRFIDSSGVYSDLVLHFDEGSVDLPKRRKTPAEPIPIVEETSEEDSEPKTALPDESEIQKEEPPLEELGLPEEAFEEEKEKEKSSADVTERSETSKEVVAAEAPASEKPGSREEEEVSAKRAAIEPEASTFPQKMEISPEKQKKPHRMAKLSDRAKSGPGLLVILIILAGIIVTGIYVWPPIGPSASSNFVYYTSYLSDPNGNSKLTLDITNADGVENEIELVLPSNIESISAKGGVITVSHGEDTQIKLDSLADARVTVSLSEHLETIPVMLNLSIPSGFDSGLVVHGDDYDVTRRDERIILRFNCTQEPVKFDQSYSTR